ncbi:hypothetical protein BraRD5C2_55410 [Bradyrhizobium sp. RD5-C2]|nr:hypothetical protein BraRD5C2_55410 [Bradyrhizobium sp. RD5-C2]
MVRLFLVILTVTEIMAVELAAPALAQVDAHDAGARAVPPPSSALTQPPINAPSAEVPSTPQAGPMSQAGASRHTPTPSQCARLLPRAELVPELQLSPDYQACKTVFPNSVSGGFFNHAPNAPPMDR